jgi:hypothetical protein
MEINDVEVKEKYQVKMSNRFVALENFGDDVDIKRVWKNIRENARTSASDSLADNELKLHNPWFHEECPKL